MGGANNFVLKIDKGISYYDYYFFKGDYHSSGDTLVTVTIPLLSLVLSPNVNVNTYTGHLSGYGYASIAYVRPSFDDNTLTMYNQYCNYREIYGIKLIPKTNIKEFKRVK